MQNNVWENEYKNPKLVSLSKEPIASIKDFVRYLRKNFDYNFSSIKILDLGCGNAKNSLYIKEQGFDNEIVGIDISETALKYAKDLVGQGNFIKQSIGESLKFPDSYFDIVLDVTSSNSLFESERIIYLNEIQRVLKSDGYLFVRALCKDGDTNAKKLLKSNPGVEKDTYKMPEIGLIERVFSKEDIISIYSNIGELLYLNKETHYTKFNGRSFKRNFWIGVWHKK